MKKNFTLFSILLFILSLSVAQGNGSQKSLVKPHNNSLHQSPKKGTNATSNHKKLPALKSKKNKENTRADNTTSTGSADNSGNITGIWKGYFVQNTLGFYEDRYRFEVQLAQVANDALNGVTYSYKTTVFYGKAEVKGINTRKTNNIIINELKLVDLKIADQSSPCLMTCYLEYNKMGDLETLTGTYSSRNVKDKSDCGSGKVYLEKTPTSDFYKEDFVAKREEELKQSKRSVAKKPVTTKKVLAKSRPTDQAVAGATAPKKNGIKPGAEGNVIDKTENKAIQKAPETVVVPKKETPATITPLPPAVKTMPKPQVLKTRDNELVKTITTHAKEFKIDLYDNGEIDGDRISVYHNNELIVANKLLTDKPISFTIKADESIPVHEFVMVAENLGSIPPNTALMIVTAGEQRYELFITSSEQKNAVVKVVFQPEK